VTYFLLVKKKKKKKGFFSNFSSRAFVTVHLHRDPQLSSPTAPLQVGLTIWRDKHLFWFLGCDKVCYAEPSRQMQMTLFTVVRALSRGTPTSMHVLSLIMPVSARLGSLSLSLSLSPYKQTTTRTIPLRIVFSSLSLIQQKTMRF